MQNKNLNKYENVFFFCIWGKKYIDEFDKFTAEALVNNLKKINNNNNLILIWTTKNDYQHFKKFKNIKKLKKIVKIKFYFFDLLKDQYILKTSKYSFLSMLQSLMISSISFYCKYIWFLYPDFIFSNSAISNITKKLRKNSKISGVLMPVPQVNQESLNTLKKKYGINYILNNLSDIIIDNLHDIVKIYDVRNTTLNTMSVSCIHENDYLLMNNFHLHPIVIKTDVKNYDYFASVLPSLDEGYTRSLNKKKCFYPLKMNEVAFASLLSEKEYNFKKDNFNLDYAISWCEGHINEFQRKHSNITFTFYKNKGSYKDINFNKKLLTTFKKRIMNKLNKTNSELYKSGNYNQLAIRLNNNLDFDVNKEQLIQLNKIYLIKIFKNQFFKIFKKKKEELLLDIYKKNKSNLSKWLYDLHKFSSKI